MVDSIGKRVHSFQFFSGGLFFSSVFALPLYLHLPLVNVKIVVDLVGSFATFDTEEIVDVLKMSANSHLVFLVVLVDRHLVASHWCKRNSHFSVKTPAIKHLFQLFRIELVFSTLGDHIWVFIVLVHYVLCFH